MWEICSKPHEHTQLTNFKAFTSFLHLQGQASGKRSTSWSFLPGTKSFGMEYAARPIISIIKASTTFSFSSSLLQEDLKSKATCQENFRLLLTVKLSRSNLNPGERCYLNPGERCFSKNSTTRSWKHVRWPGQANSEKWSHMQSSKSTSTQSYTLYCTSLNDKESRGTGSNPHPLKPHVLPSNKVITCRKNLENEYMILSAQRDSYFLFHVDFFQQHSAFFSTTSNMHTEAY